MRNSILQFKDYTVNILKFEQHDWEGDEDSAEIKQSLSRALRQGENGAFDALLNFKTCPKENGKNPFDIEVQITGHFRIVSEDGAEADADTVSCMMNQNSYAILFPYLRAIITNLTATANIPPIVLPVINLTGE